MDLKEHASASKNISDAAAYAKGISDNLTVINRGASGSQEELRLVEQVSMWMGRLAELLGYKLEHLA